MCGEYLIRVGNSLMATFMCVVECYAHYVTK